MGTSRRNGRHPHLNQGQPWAIGRHIEPGPPPCRGTDDRVDRRIGMGIRVLPGHIEGTHGMLVDEGLQQVGDLLAPFTATEAHDGVAGVALTALRP
jgi:hypothetical protein